MGSLRSTIAELPWTNVFILLFTVCNGTWAIPLAEPVPAGPLGDVPGGPNIGNIPAGSSSSNGTSGNIVSTSSIRSTSTILAVISVILVTSTYAILIGPGTQLTSTSKLPLASIEANIGNLLSRAWVDKSTSGDVGDTSGDGEESDAIRLFYMGRTLSLASCTLQREYYTSQHSPPADASKSAFSAS